MAFRELLIVQAPGISEVERIERRNSLSHTTVALVPGQQSAVDVVREAAAEAPDLVELYGGLGPDVAVQVGELVPAAAVGMLGVQWDDRPDGRAVIVESPDADPARDRHTVGTGRGRTTVVFVPAADDAPRVARELVEAGVGRIELCGGMGAGPAAAVTVAVAGRARIGAVLFGFESIPAAAAYRAAFEQVVAQPVST